MCGDSNFWAMIKIRQVDGRLRTKLRQSLYWCCRCCIRHFQPCMEDVFTTSRQSRAYYLDVPTQTELISNREVSYINISWVQGLGRTLHHILYVRKAMSITVRVVKGACLSKNRPQRRTWPTSCPLKNQVSPTYHIFVMDLRNRCRNHISVSRPEILLLLGMCLRVKVESPSPGYVTFQQGEVSVEAV